MRCVIKDGYVLDPATGIDQRCDILIEDGIIKDIGTGFNGDEVISANGLYVFPGFIDLHTHIREPGKEDREDIESGSKAAAKGGYTGVVMMPNTDPPVDDASVVEYIKRRNAEVGCVRIYPCGAITKGREGKEIAEIGSLVKAGCVAISDDGSSVMNADIMRRALEYAKMFDVVVISHPEDVNLSAGGQMNEGAVSTLLGMRGIPSISEDVMVIRDILIAGYTKSRLHLAHISTALGVEFVEWAKAKGIKVTAEATPHHLLISDKAVMGFNTNTKMNPPLREEGDRRALIEALKKGVIDVISTDHAPHADYEKDLEYDYANFGVIGLETAFSAIYTRLVEGGEFRLGDLVSRMSSIPAQIFGLPGGRIEKGGVADLTLVDLNKEWLVREDDFVSKSKNSPFLGWKLKGRVKYTIVGGKVIYRED